MRERPVAAAVAGAMGGVAVLVAYAAIASPGRPEEGSAPGSQVAAPLPSPTASATSTPAAEATSTPLPEATVVASPRPAWCPDARTLPLRKALGQTLMVGLLDPPPLVVRELLDDAAPVGGLFLRGETGTPLSDGRLEITAGSSPPPLVAADDEGGRVQRLAFVYPIPSAREQARSLTPDQVRVLAEERGRELRRHGITMDLAPVVDVGSQPDRAVIGDRSYSDDPATATAYAGAFAAGLRSAGVLPTLKHFPGHGRALGDSHHRLSVTPRADSLRAADWQPYRELAGPDVAVMMGHLNVPGLSTGRLPASLDPALYNALREEIGFRGLVLTDELASMRAIRDRFGLYESARRALAAGADMVLFNGTGAEVPRLLDRLIADVTEGQLDEVRVREAASRVLAAKGCAVPDQAPAPTWPQ